MGRAGGGQVMLVPSPAIPLSVGMVSISYPYAQIQSQIFFGLAIVLDCIHRQLFLGSTD